MQLCLERAPFLGRRAVDQRIVVRDPGEAAAQIGQLVGQQFARFEILDPRSVAFGPVVVGRIREVAPALAARERAEAEIVLALGQLVLVEKQLRIAARNGLAVMQAVVLALLEFGPVEPVAILLRHG